jgi:hypothetical protein
MAATIIKLKKKKKEVKEAELTPFQKKEKILNLRIS